MRLLIESAHCPFMHQDTEHVGNCLHQSCFIVGLPKTLRRMKHPCLSCNRFQGRAFFFKIKFDLPPTRFDDPIDDPIPFKKTRMGLIGTLDVITNSTKKICLFTCLSTYAVHMELVFFSKSNFLNVSLLEELQLSYFYFSDNDTYLTSSLRQCP